MNNSFLSILFVFSVLVSNASAKQQNTPKKTTTMATKKINTETKPTPIEVKPETVDVKPASTESKSASTAQRLLPRFATLRATKANLHVGPGPNYPVSWLLLRPGMPLEIVAEFDTWRQVRDWQGTEGWIHKSLLKGKRSFWTLHKTQDLKDKPDEKAKTIAYVQAAVIGLVYECQDKWCRVEMKSTGEENKNKTYKGWLSRQYLGRLPTRE